MSRIVVHALAPVLLLLLASCGGGEVAPATGAVDASAPHSDGAGGGGDAARSDLPRVGTRDVARSTDARVDASRGDADADAAVETIASDDGQGADTPDTADAAPRDAPTGDADTAADQVAAGDEGAVDDPCDRSVRDPDRARAVIFSLPFAPGGGPSNRWRRGTLEPDGGLKLGGADFTMRRAFGGAVRFTPGGRYGAAAQDDGSVGVFRLRDDGSVDVIDPGVEGPWYARELVFSASGRRVWIIDPNWANNGGGIYAAPFSCDGRIGAAVRLFESRNAAAFFDLGSGEGPFLLAARRALGSEEDGHAHLLTPGAPWQRLAITSAFGDDEAILAGATLADDGRYLLVGDNSAFSGIPNRVGVVRLGPDSLEAVQVLTPIGDPLALVASPFNGDVLAIDGFGNAIRLLRHRPGDTAAPYEDAGEVAYDGPRPALPGAATVITKGARAGLVVVAENVGLRRLRFTMDGGVVDDGMTPIDEADDDIPGALGLQP